MGRATQTIAAKEKTVRAQRPLPPRRMPLGAGSRFSPRAEMGANLPAVDLGPGRTAVSVSAGGAHSCAVLVRLHRIEVPQWSSVAGSRGNAALMLLWPAGFRPLSPP